MSAEGQTSQDASELKQAQQEALSRLNGPKFDWKRIATFLCQHHKVSDLPYIHPYGVGAVDAWKLSNEKTIGVEYTIEGTFNTEKGPEEQVIRVLLPEGRPLYKTAQPSQRFQHPKTGEPMESNLNEVSIYQVACRAYSSTMPIPVAVRQTWDHASMRILEGTDVTDEMFAAADAIKGAFVVLDPTKDGTEEALQSFPLPELSHGYQNSPFAKTYAYLNKKNLWNGIIEIPSEVCEEARLPIWKGPPEAPEDLVLKQFRALKIEDPSSEKAISVRKEVSAQFGEQFMEQFSEDKSAKPITHYFAVPANHVLAWGYLSDEYRNQQGHRAYRFSYRTDSKSDPVLMYFLLPNPLFEHVMEEAIETLLDKVDKRPLNSVGMEFLPRINPSYPLDGQETQRASGKVTLRTYYSYLSGPSLGQATIDALAPTMAPDFFSCHTWSREERARQAAFEEWERQNEK